MTDKHDPRYDYEMTLLEFPREELTGLHGAGRGLNYYCHDERVDSIYRQDTNGVLVVHLNMHLNGRPFRLGVPPWGAILWAPNELTQGVLSTPLDNLSGYYRVITDGRWQTLFANMCPRQWDTAQAATRFLSDLFRSLNNFGRRVKAAELDLHKQLLEFVQMTSITGHLYECLVCRDIWAMHVLPQIREVDQRRSY